jgi:hypothetical protein
MRWILFVFSALLGDMLSSAPLLGDIKWVCSLGSTVVSIFPLRRALGDYAPGLRRTYLGWPLRRWRRRCWANEFGSNGLTSRRRWCRYGPHRVRAPETSWQVHGAVYLAVVPICCMCTRRDALPLSPNFLEVFGGLLAFFLDWGW